jgi:hypothetical protein
VVGMPVIIIYEYLHEMRGGMFVPYIWSMCAGLEILENTVSPAQRYKPEVRSDQELRFY